MALFVGLTGGIGSGKSTVSRMLAARGAFLIDADALAREVVAPGEPAETELRAAFGEAIFAPDGRLDRKALAAIVFREPEARARLNGIVHPRVAQRAVERRDQAEREGAAVVIYDVPLLFENGLRGLFDEVVVVSVPPELQRARVAARDGASPEEIEGRIAAQHPLAMKAAQADVVIDNAGSLERTEAQVDALWRRWTRAA